MKLKKSIALIVSAGLIATALAGCNGKNDVSSVDTSKEMTLSISHYIDGDTALPEGETEYTKLVKEKFNLNLEYSLVPRANYEQKMNLLFAAGEQPDVLTGAKEPLYKKWGAKGYIQPIDLKKVEEMKNYRAFWPEEETWEKILSLTTTNEGVLYYLPSVTVNKAGGNFTYRKDLFDAVGYTEFPSTTEELRDAFAKIHALYPNKILYNEKSPFYQMFWMPELLKNEVSYVDPITGEYVPYAFVTDRARDMFIYMHDLYKDGLLDPEMMTSTSSRNTEKKYTGSIILAFGDPGLDTTYNLRTEDKDIPASQKVEWKTTPHMITAYPDLGWIFKRTAYYANWGPVFTYNLDENGMDRALQYFDWTASPEGEEVLTFGFEGTTFHYDENGKPVKNDEIYDKYNNPNGLGLIHWGIPTWKFRGDQRSVKPESAEGFANTAEFQFNEPKYYHFDYFSMDYSEADDESRADLEAAVDEVKETYFAKFVIGEKDPANDADWNEYITAMTNAGLKQLAEIKTRTYKNSNSK